MELFEAIHTRRSIRRFTGQVIPDEVLEQVFVAATYAPSAHNGQPWVFCVTRDPEKKQALAEGRRYAAFLPQAGAVVAVLAKVGLFERPVGDKGLRYFEFQDTAAAIQNLLLAAHASGLGGCWVGDFADAQVRAVFGVPEDLTPVAVIALGYPQSVPDKGPARRPLTEVVHWEQYQPAEE